MLKYGSSIQKSKELILIKMLFKNIIECILIIIKFETFLANSQIK